MKPFKETKLGKLLSSKGVDKALDVADIMGVPGASQLNKIKDWALGSQDISEAERKLILEEYDRYLQELDKILLDKQSARSREVELAKANKSDWLLALVVIVAMLLWLSSLAIVIFVNIPEQNHDIFREYSITIRDVAIMTFSYFLGSSVGSKRKNDVIESFSKK